MKLISQAQLNSLVHGVELGDEDEMLRLYGIISGYVGSVTSKQLPGEHWLDHIHDIYVAIVEIIRNGRLDDPLCLMGMIRIVTSRHVLHRIQQRIGDRGRAARHEADHREVDELVPYVVTPEALAINAELSALCETALRRLSPKDQEVLIRYYIHEQKGPQVKAAMGLNETQYRLLKSRALCKFGKAGRKFLGKRKLKGLAAAA